MEENREQPTMEPTTALAEVDEKRVVSDVGSQNNLGKFKDAQSLLEAYNNLQSAFTRKCQLLSELQKDKTEEKEKAIASLQNVQNRDESGVIDEKINNFKTEAVTTSEANFDATASQESEVLKFAEDDFQNDFNQFLESNEEAKAYADEIKTYLESKNTNNKNPFEDAWAQVVLSHLKSDQKNGDPIINQYVLNDENVKNSILESYLSELSKNKPPKVISSQGGERVSGVMPPRPQTLDEAKKILNNMFS